MPSLDPPYLVEDFGMHLRRCARSHKHTGARLSQSSLGLSIAGVSFIIGANEAFLFVSQLAYGKQGISDVHCGGCTLRSLAEDYLIITYMKSTTPFNVNVHFM